MSTIPKQVIRSEQLLRLGVAGRRRAKEEIDRTRTVLHAVAQYVDDAAFGDLALKAVEELDALRAIRADAERLDGRWLRGDQEGEKLGQVDGMVAVIVPRVPGGIAGLVDQRADDERFQAFLACQSSRQASSITSASFGSVPSSRSLVPSNAGSSPDPGISTSRTSSLPLTTSPIRRVRYSRSSSIWRRARSTAVSMSAVALSR